MCWKTIKRWFGGGNNEPEPTRAPPPPPTQPLKIPYPEEPENPAQTIENTNLDEVVTRWLTERNVPQVHWSFWRTKIEITLDPDYQYPAGVWESTDGIRHLTIRPSFVNTGVIAHEQAHSSYDLLSDEQKTAFEAAYNRLKTTDPLIVHLFEINDYGLRGGPIEGHAEFYRYLCEYMPEELKQFYPKLFVEKREEVKRKMNRVSTEETLLTSHRIFRLVIGSLGIALPLILMFWGFGIIGWTIQDSISDYYSLRTRDVFVAILFIIGWFLFSYQGHEKTDNIAGYLACFFAMGVAFFPNSGASWERIVHFACAAGLFLVLAFFSMFLFTKTLESPRGFKQTLSSFRFGVIKSDDPQKQKKKQRNVIYIICGIIILLCLVLILIYNSFLQDTSLADIKPVFWLETIMIWAFGVSWFIKGETLFRDKE